jgi:succinoglycan biosynthesis transport protein ExoP
MALVLDTLDNTISSVADVEKITARPVLASIPRYVELEETQNINGPRAVGHSFDLVTSHDSKSTTAEAYRELRTAILLSHAGQPPAHIMLTSAIPQEGKSAISINLSIVLAQLGRRVLLTDTDLRRPRLHKALDVSNNRGISTFLSGLAEFNDNLIVNTPIENLDLLPSGPIPPNPSELLSSAKFDELLETAQKEGYDHVVLDSPPIISVPDSVIIASKVDAKIIVVRFGKATRQTIKQAVDKIEASGTRISGVVLNDIRSTQHGAYHYYYSEQTDDTDQTPRKPGWRRAGSTKT